MNRCTPGNGRGGLDAARIREEAMRRVDRRYDHTLAECAVPELHQAEYDDEEKRLREVEEPSAATVRVEVTAVPYGFWLIKPTTLMYRLGLRRLALAIAERWVGLDVYADGRYLFSVGLRRKDSA